MVRFHKTSSGVTVLVWSRNEMKITNVLTFTMTTFPSFLQFDKIFQEKDDFEDDFQFNIFCHRTIVQSLNLCGGLCTTLDVTQEMRKLSSFPEFLAELKK